MSLSSSARAFAAQNYPASPGAATPSSVNYSQHGGSAFSPSSRTDGPMSSSFGASSSRMNGAGSSASAGRSGSGGGLRPPGDKKVESRDVARVHYRALKRFLAQWLERESPSSRASAREKLTRLTKLQFQELSTDVYDELMRRIAAEQGETAGDVPFLPVRDDFHPKRNQARQKLATLPRNRFKDLASDVFFELRRRYPEFEEEADQEAEEDRERLYDEPPPAPGPRHLFAAAAHSSNPSQTSFSQPERQRSTPTPPPMARLNSAQSNHRRQASRNVSGGSSVGSAAVPAHRQRPSRNDGPGSRNQPNPSAATSDMVVPNKSRMREEEIEVPYARDSQVMDEPRAQSRTSNRSSSRASYQDDRRTPLGTRQDSGDVLSPQSADDREYYDRMSFSSNITSKSKPGPTGWDDEREQKIRSEYELRIAGLERRLGVAETERDEAKRTEALASERRREIEDEVRGLKERATTHASSLRSLQHELDIARDATEAARSHGQQSSRGAEEEVGRLRERCEGLEEEVRRLEEESRSSGHQRNQSSGHDDETVRELKDEIHSLVDELNALSARNDELMAEREQDAEGMDEMESKVQEYKRKYDAVRIELRNLKATSTMFVSKPLSDDHLPASADGNIEDVHVSAFQTAIDGLLTAARSSAPSGVLPAMKAVVESVTEVGEDVKAFEAQPNLDVDVSRLESLKHESTSRLNNLMQAARNHAMASGLSPVSLLDAAAGHLTSNVIEIIKLLKIKRSDKNRELRRSRSSMSIRDMVNRSNSGTNLGRDVGRANGDWDREYGSNSNNNQEERLRESPTVEPPVIEPRPGPSPLNTQTQSYPQVSTPTELTPASAYPNAYSAQSRQNGSYTSMDRQGSHQAFRVNSYQSASSQKSDSFDLERKASVSSNRADPRAMVESRNGSLGPGGYGGGAPAVSPSMISPMRETPMSPPGMPYEKDQSGEFGYDEPPAPEPTSENDGADEREWEDLKPYLNAQSSALVNSIQNLLAAIRTSSPPPVLNEHLSEVIAIASSIVAVSTNALPASLRAEGDGLLKELVRDTDRLSEAQGSAVNTGDKSVRQQIASASFGVAKSLKALMKLGSD